MSGLFLVGIYIIVQAFCSVHTEKIITFNYIFETNMVKESINGVVTALLFNSGSILFGTILQNLVTVNVWNDDLEIVSIL